MATTELGESKLAVNMDTSETCDKETGLEELGDQRESLKVFLTEISEEKASVDVEKLKSVLESAPVDKLVPLLGCVRNDEEDSIVHKAIEGELIDVVKAVFERLSEVERLRFMQQHLDKDGRNLVLHCIAKKRNEILDYILQFFAIDEHDIMFQMRDKSGKNTLHYICSSMVTHEVYDKIIKLLPYREMYKYMCVTDELGWAPLNYAMSHDRSMLSSLLFNVDGRQLAKLTLIKDVQGNTLLLQLTKSRRVIEVKDLLNRVPEETRQGMLTECDSNGMNSVLIAAEYGSVDMIKELLYHQSRRQVYAILITRDRNGCTPLHHAVKNKSPVMINCFIGGVHTKQQQDDLMNLRDNANLLPLDYAGLANDTKCMVGMLNFYEPHRQIEFLLRLTALQRDRAPALAGKPSPELLAVDKIIELELKHTEVKKELLKIEIEHESLSWTVRSSVEHRIANLEIEKKKCEEELELVKWKRERNHADGLREIKYQEERLAEIREAYAKVFPKAAEVAADK